MVKSTADPEELVTEYARIWNEREFSELADVVADSYTFASPMAGEIVGRENVKAYANGVVSGFSDFQITIHEVLAGEDLVMTESTLSGTHDGEYNGIPPTYETFEVPEMAKFVVEDDRLREERTYFDRHDFLGQLGLVNE